MPIWSNFNGAVFGARTQMTSAAHIHLVNLRRSGGFETNRRRIPYTKEFCHYLQHFKEPSRESRVTSRPKTVPKKKRGIASYRIHVISTMGMVHTKYLYILYIYVCNTWGNIFKMFQMLCCQASSRSQISWKVARIASRDFRTRAINPWPFPWRFFLNNF